MIMLIQNSVVGLNVIVIIGFFYKNRKVCIKHEYII